ncbi:MAG: ribonuclease HII [Oscillospiraceae bacterium]|jgi:ribonuclease HII|nr:ribonuclease HII [Oscillospiraceae bacterium]
MSDALWVFDETVRAGGPRVLCGVDEAGRGPLAGPVMAAAVVLSAPIEGVRDSKTLSPRRREALFDRIVREALCWAVAEASVAEIETYNILGASQLAMRRAVAALSVRPDLTLVDGNVARDFSAPVRCLVGGDNRSACVAAASILAKVTRDRRMDELARLYPAYGFERHRGYPTKMHYEVLRALGPTPVHRAHFLRRFRAAGGGL